MSADSGEEASAALAAGKAAELKGDLDGAVEQFRRAIALAPQSARPHLAISHVELRRCCFFEAEAAARDAIRLDPRLRAPYLNLAKVFSNTGRLDAALALYREILARTDDAPAVFSDYLFTLIHSGGHSREAVFAEHVRFGESLAARLPPTSAHANDPDPERRLKLAYVSADVGRHIVAAMLQAMLRAHDRSRFEVFIYDNAPSAVQRALPGECFDHWLEVARLDDAALAERVRADEIDVLVDLSGHTGGNRLPAFARKPAPVQVSWLGYPFTTGVWAIDYRICDARQMGPGSAALFVEEPFVVPGASVAFMPPEDPAPAAPPCHANGYVTYGSVNSLDKIDGASLALWAEVLRSVPASRLLIKAHGLHDERQQKRLSEHLAHLGVAPERLMFEGGSPPRAFREGFSRVDIALDTVPHTGGSTTRHTVWMGVPVITLESVALYERFSGAILRELGLAECVATDTAGYVAAAAALAGDRARLAKLRRDLRPRIRASALCDVSGQARRLEEAYREMWRRWCAGSAKIRPRLSG
jgi:predicted O-linked N-acetylglucosamine transferase (SPINDLY family)